MENLVLDLEWLEWINMVVDGKTFRLNNASVLEKYDI